MTKKEGGSGIITNINTDKFYAFIKSPSRNKDLFFHGTDLIDSDIRFEDIKKGDEVKFAFSESGEKGDIAREVSLCTS